MRDVIQEIIDSTNYWGGWGHQNSQLELAVYVLEAKNADLDYLRLKPLYDKQVQYTRTTPGIFLRTPKGEYSSDMSNSHDNWIGLAILSYLFDDGKVAREILDEGVKFGLWLTGPNEKGKLIDSEWFTPLRPEYRAIMKLAAGRKLTILEKTGLEVNLLTSRAWNMKRTRILFLRALGYKDNKPSLLTRIVCKLAKKPIDVNAGFIEQSEVLMGDDFKGRYGDEPILNYIWNLTNT